MGNTAACPVVFDGFLQCFCERFSLFGSKIVCEVNELLRPGAGSVTPLGLPYVLNPDFDARGNLILGRTAA